MKAILKPRPYQTEALAAIAADWAAGHQRTAVVLPTGLGKTVIFSHAASQEVAKGGKVLILVHRDELAKQAADKVRSVDPGVSVGIVKAAQNDVYASVVVASVQTLRNPNRMAQLQGVTMIVIDECHHAAADSYRAILAWYADAKVVGFTATFQRADKKKIADVIPKIAYTKDIVYGITNGYLCDVEGRAITVPDLDLSKVKVTMGDYQDEALGKALEVAEAGKFIAAEYLQHCPDRRGVLFAPSVATARMFADDLNAAGIVTEVITGSTPIEVRQAIYKRYEQGRTQVLSNCMVLTEGWDAPHAEVCVVARPTKAQSLYIQMVGRVLRPFPGKSKALVLDVMGVSEELSIVSLADLVPSKPKVDKGMSLMEAVEKEEKEEKEKAALGAKHFATQSVDLFHGSKSIWLQTYKGVWFVPVKDGIFFLWPSDDSTWIIGRKRRYKNAEQLMTGLTLDMAMSWAEQLADDEDGSVSSKKASWRKKNVAPTEPQVKAAGIAKLDITGKNKPQVSDMLSVHYASKDIPMGYPEVK